MNSNSDQTLNDHAARHTDDRQNYGDQGPKSIPQIAKQTVAATAHMATEKVREQTGVAKEKVLHRIDAQKENAAAKVADIGEAIREAEVSLIEKNHARAAEYVGRVADRFEAFAHRVETTHPKDLYLSANEFARRRPKLTVAALFVGGLALGRFLRASRHENSAFDGEDFHDRWGNNRNGRTDDPVGRWLDDGGEPLPAESNDRHARSSLSGESTLPRQPAFGNPEDGTLRTSVD
jgi:hypothetical protein